MTLTPGPVLAGIDGSSDNMVAAHVAAVEARRRDLPLRLVLSYPHPPDPPGHGVAAPPGSRSSDITPQSTDRALQRIRHIWPKLSVVSDAPGRDFVDTLVEQSRDSDLLVVDAQHLDGYDSLLGRWLNDRVVTHAHCPVLVLRDGADAGGARVARRPVLIGIDGSEHCAAAMPPAVEEALRRGVPLWAVSVHCIGPRTTVGVDDAQSYCASTAQAQAADLIAEALAGWTDRYPQLEVIRQPMYAPDVASALVDASAAADLVVVGCRGRTALTSLRLGSVSQALVRYAHCPVLVAHACGDRRSNASVTVGRAGRDPGRRSIGRSRCVR
jgi:nucleotide-binding universal stress UspA family protein